MGLGNGNPKAGDKGSNHNYEHRELLILGKIVSAITGTGQAPAPLGIATESTLQTTNATLISVLAAIVASDQDIETLLVRDEAVGNGNPVLQQVTNYQTGVPVITYLNVDGSVYMPSPNPPVYVYLDPSAVLNLMLAELVQLNAGGPLLTEARFVAEDFATEVTLAAVSTALAITVRTPALLVVSGVASTTVAAGARSVTFFNQGPTAATVAGGVLDAGESMTFDAGGQRDTLGAIAYVTIATGVLKISTVV